MELVRYADRPDLRARRFAELSGITFPAYMHHNEVGPRFWGRLYDDFADFQVALVQGDELLAEAHAVPVSWDGSLEDLPSGWDEAFELGMMSDAAPSALCALAISVAPGHQGEGLSGRMIGSFIENAGKAGLSAVIAPVRPTLKERYPLIPIERYVSWRRADGTHFDPWIRIHERVGGRVLAPAPESMTIRAPVEDWEEWTGMRFPDDGTYVFPGGLAPLEIEAGTGTHVEPNVWLQHAAAVESP
jgi:GNAT superfamily N-acetyltransferase